MRKKEKKLEENLYYKINVKCVGCPPHKACRNCAKAHPKAQRMRTFINETS